ncbi:MAG TPA: diacylglycerol kinase family protein [Nocardioidaceae bacterium]|nr:diacylglycerol kinase family protein [Nocardioidaceae bacterium]
MYVVTNPEAGTADGFDDAVAHLGEHRSGPLDELPEDEDVVVAAGGDGTLHAVVAELYRRKLLDTVTVGLIPLGTGNDFARGAGIPLEPAEAARLVRDGAPTAVDLLVDDGDHVVVNNVHVGAGAEAARAARPWKKLLGPLGYAVGAATTAVRPPTLRLRVAVDGEVVSDRRTLQVAVGNAPYVGGGTPLTPRADLSDGKVDVMLSYALGPWARVGYALHLRRGSHHRRDDVRYVRGASVTVAGEPFHVSADGEIEGPLSSRTWTVLPGALTMVIGDDPAAS